MLSRKIYSVFILFMVITPSLLAQQEADYVEGAIIFQVATPFETVQTEDGLITTEQSWFNSLAQQYQIKELNQVFSSQWKFRRFYQAVFDSTYSVEEVVNAFESEFEVIFAEPNYIFELYANPNDPHFNKQWGLRKIKADSAWNIESGNYSVIVGVVDTGTDLVDNNGNPHEDLWANLWNENGMYGYNVLDSVQIPDDDNGHGTHVAGIAGAVTNNNTGVAGTAGGGFSGDEGIQIMSVKSFNFRGRGLAPDIAEGIRWAVDPDDNPATNDGSGILNMSFGGTAYSATIDSAIQYADSLGTVLIAAAGNSILDLDEYNVYPAEFEEVIAVAATDSSDVRSFFSNFGSSIEVCAPGGVDGTVTNPENIYSTTPMDTNFYLHDTRGLTPEYGYLAGTSMSTPFVSGVAGLLKSFDNTLVSQEVRNLIAGTADPIEEQFHDEFAGKLGAGRLNAYAALSALQSGISHPNLVYFGRDILNDTSGDNILNVGESADLVIFLKNFWENATEVTMTISSENPFVTISDSVATFGNIPNGEIGSNALDTLVVQVSNDAVPGEYAFQAQVQSGLYFKEFTFYINVYNSLSPGFPVSLPNETVEGEPKIADLDLNGERQMVVLAKSGKVYIVHGDGQIDAPIYDNAGELVSAPALGDLDGNGELDIIFASRNGYLYVIDHTGSDLPNFPINLQNDFVASPVLADVDGDHDLEIAVCGYQQTAAYNVFCVESDGTIKWQKTTNSSIRKSPAIGDYNYDSIEDIYTQSVFGAKITIFNGGNGDVYAQNTISGAGNPQSALTIGYIDDTDLYYDIITTSLFTPSEQEETRNFLINGSDLSEIFSTATNEPFTTPIMDIISGNSSLEYVVHFIPPRTNIEKGLIELYDKNGQQLAAVSAAYPYFQFLAADLNDDNQQEILAVSNHNLNILDENLHT